MFGVKILEERTSKYNKNICVVKPWFSSPYIQVNGLTQSGGVVESIWDSTLRKIHRSQFTVHSSLVLGLGGGTVAKLIHKYWPKAKITGVEIDPVMVELGKKYLDLDTKKTKVIIADALAYSLYANRYNLVIVDTYIGDKYVEITRSHLVMGEITVFNRLYYGDKKQEALKFGEKLKKIYKKVETFYPQANIMFICWSKYT